MGPGRRSGSAQDAGDVVGGVDNLEDAHAAATFSAAMSSEKTRRTPAMSSAVSTTSRTVTASRNPVCQARLRLVHYTKP